MTLYYESSLCHHGVKGMKWGVRRYQNKNGQLTSAGKKHYSTKTKNDETLSIERVTAGRFGKFLGKISPKIREEQQKSHNFDAIVNGKKVGDLQLYRKSDNEMNIVWGDTKKSQRGKGYMQASLKLGEQYAKDQGAKLMTAELVGTSPDIHTVANKAGYVKVGEIKTQEMLDAWGGLTLVEKKLR